MAKKANQKIKPVKKSRWQGVEYKKARSSVKDASDAHNPGGFYVRVLERNEMGCCADEVHITLVFDSLRDFAEFLKYMYLPMIFMESLGQEIQGRINEVTSYTPGAEDWKAEPSEKLDKELSQILGKNTVTRGDIDKAVKSFNEIFDQDGSRFSICHTGELGAIVKKMAVLDDWGDKRDDADRKELEEFEAVSLALEGKLDGKNKKHIKAAREFFEELIEC